MTKDEMDLQFYSAALNAWYATELEHDRSLLTLSVGGIGLHLTLLSTVGASSLWIALLSIAALLAFLVSVFAVLRIFKMNGEHIQRIINLNIERNPTLKRWDRVAIGTFFFGVLFSLMVGVCAALQYPRTGEVAMSGKINDQSEVPQKGEAPQGTANTRQSQGDLKRSFEGAANLRPMPSKPVAEEPKPEAAPKPRGDESK